MKVSFLNGTVEILLLAVFLMSPLNAQQLDYLPKAPFYKNYRKESVAATGTLRLPVQIDKNIFEEFFYKGRENALQPLQTAIDQYLDSLNTIAAIDSPQFPIKGWPSIFVGSSEAETAPPGSEMMREDHHKFPPMVIQIQKPSRDWKAVQQIAMSEQNSKWLLVMWLGFSEFPKANKGIFGKKVVLGTNHEPEIRFLSAEDKPVEVLLLSGMLINEKGEIVRAGAEGIVHEDTPFWGQVFDIKKAIDDKTLQKHILNYRREDLPDKPLAWRVATDHLLRQLVSGK